jgi:hypothetical protein
MVPTNKRTTPEGGCVDASVKWYRTTTNNLFSSQRAYVGYKGKKRDMKYKIIDPFILFCTRFPQHTILANALVDRLTHNAYLVNMNGVSYRLKETKNFNQKIQKKDGK